MTTNRRRQSFPLRLSPHARTQASEQARREGISLNHFISLAVAEKISRTEQDTLQRQQPPEPRLRTEAPLQSPDRHASGQ
ncbi:HicB family protein [Bryocella elongata]|uniref:HicB family protein n=1 Tax=Bryocella elongata TaxID=863522 RepID=A0A1H6A1H1_9BACT|nr:toxin-antitoxin system HicB family antitoxin [Bryocella elongata]SEG42579.1 HicB family protein [Bryocella elongata]